MISQSRAAATLSAILLLPEAVGPPMRMIPGGFKCRSVSNVEKPLVKSLLRAVAAFLGSIELA